MDNTYFRHCVVPSKVKNLYAFASLDYSPERNVCTTIKMRLSHLSPRYFRRLVFSYLEIHFRTLKHTLLVYDWYLSHLYFRKWYVF